MCQQPKLPAMRGKQQQSKPAKALEVLQNGTGCFETKQSEGLLWGQHVAERAVLLKRLAGMAFALIVS